MRELLARGVLASIVVIASGCGDLSAWAGPSALTDVTLSPAGGAFGVHVCTPRALHGCTGRTVLRQGVRVIGPIDIAASSSCASLASDTASRCPGPPSDPSTLRCFAEHGVLLDTHATWGPPGAADEPTSRFTLHCAEGEAWIDVIEPP
ncbi:MAG: hypothetical protein M3Y87_32450 [Myxococcota bacterium]|nr:hypothetical protein [Myxococcota bacterium]